MLREAISEVHRGRIWVDSQVGCADMFAFLSHKANMSHQREAEIDPFNVLSKRELEILHLITEGVSNEEIAGRLFISIATVKAHITHIFDKLNVNNRVKAALVLVQARMGNSYDFSPVPYSANHRDSNGGSFRNRQNVSR
jgi:DNA-binding NarL/FixJ family response regulator